jgi:hypothetical protein
MTVDEMPVEEMTCCQATIIASLFFSLILSSSCPLSLPFNLSLSPHFILDFWGFNFTAQLYKEFYVGSVFLLTVFMLIVFVLSGIMMNICMLIKNPQA